MSTFIQTTLLAACAMTAATALAATTADFHRPAHLPDILDAYWSEQYTHPFECRRVFHASPLQLPRCMQSRHILEHLTALQNIADQHGGNRASGLPGYEDSVDYISTQLAQLGYKVTLDGFDFNAFYEQSDGQLLALSPQAVSYQWAVDFTYLSQSEAGDATAAVQAVDLDLGANNSSSSGCEAEDFADFNAGNIALLQRGTCTFQLKAENAANAGAVGVIIFNQGNSDDRTGLISATLGADYAGGVPVFFATYSLGIVFAQTDNLVVNMVADVIREQRRVNNVIAETQWGDADNVIMLGAHLDSVSEGPGINDNGTGSAALLELAKLVKHAYARNKIRIAWWGAEESGLVGSTDYVNRLSDAELAKIKVYLNFDMIGSPNFYYGIYDGDGSTFELEGPAGSKATEALFEKYFRLRGQPFEGSEISFRSDYAQFFERGVAFGGLFTGAEAVKSQAQAERYGGEAGVAFDQCYHQACDDMNNLNNRAIEVNADAIAFVTGVFANSTRLIDEEIAAAAKAAINNERMVNNMYNAATFDKTHWGKHWIK